MSEGKPSVITVTLAVTVDGREVELRRVYRPDLINEATAELVVEDIFKILEDELEVVEEAMPCMSKAEGDK